MRQPRIVVMGPSGSGKSLIGGLLAARLAVAFIDADDLHPAANRVKMAAGIALEDGDRMPWLDAVGIAIDAEVDGVVVACSALRRRYRDRIRLAASEVVFVELDTDAVILAERMQSRTHFMPPSLLQSQLTALETLACDEPGIVVANEDEPAAVVEAIVAALADR